MSGLLRTICRRLLVSFGFSGLFLVFGTSAAWAHNSLVASTPSDQSSLSESPAELSLRFAKELALDTLTVRIQAADGSTSKLNDSKFGSEGTTEAVFALPAVAAGPSTVRWKIVGADGHPISGTVGFVVTGNAFGAGDPATTGLPADLGAGEALPVETESIIASEPSAASSPRSNGGSSEQFSAPTPVRWLLRYGSYLALLLVAGIVLTDAFVWGGALNNATLRRSAAAGISVAALFSLLQLLVIATDINGLGSWGAALQTDAGVAFAVRIVLLGVAGALLFLEFHLDAFQRDISTAAIFVLLFGTWAYAGHSRSMRWPVLGVPLDVAHHVAAAAWLGGLGVLTFVTIPNENRKTVVESVRRFAKVAELSVGVIVGTGVLQAVRLEGNPVKLFTVNHGRYLLFKLVILAVMLMVADVNRRRVADRFQVEGVVITKRFVSVLRKAMRTEFGIGLMIIGITAAMVVSPPGVASNTSQSVKPGSVRTDPSPVEGSSPTEASLPLETSVVVGSQLSLATLPPLSPEIP